jgi:hypothetical protein
MSIVNKFAHDSTDRKHWTVTNILDNSTIRRQLHKFIALLIDFSIQMAQTVG